MIKKYSLGILFTTFFLVFHLVYGKEIIQYFLVSNIPKDSSFFISRIPFWLIVLFIFTYARKVEGGSISLWKEQIYPLTFYLKKIPYLYLITLGAAALINLILQAIINENLSGKLINTTLLFKDSYFLLVFTCLTAGVTEELMMRGYIQTRLEKIYSSRWVGIIASSLLFGIMHITYGTYKQLIGTTIIGLFLAYNYHRKRSLLLVIIVHFLIDFITLNVIYLNNL